MIPLAQAGIFPKKLKNKITTTPYLQDPYPPVALYQYLYPGLKVKILSLLSKI